MLIKPIEFSAYIQLAVCLLEQGTTIRFRGNGQSMLPTIPDGSLVIIEPIKKLPQFADILFFQHSDSQYFIHRVVGKKKTSVGETRYLMQGDSNPYSDGWIEEARILGKVSHIYKKNLPQPINPAMSILTAAILKTKSIIIRNNLIK